VADLGEGLGVRSLLFWVTEEEITEGRKAGRVSKTKPPSPPLSQGLDPPLHSHSVLVILSIAKAGNVFPPPAFMIYSLTQEIKIKFSLIVCL